MKIKLETKTEPKIYQIAAQKWQRELIEVLAEIRPAYFYTVEQVFELGDVTDEDVSANACSLTNLDGTNLTSIEDYDTAAYLGNVAFIVSDQELSQARLKQIGIQLLKNHT